MTELAYKCLRMKTLWVVTWTFTSSMAFVLVVAVRTLSSSKHGQKREVLTTSQNYVLQTHPAQVLVSPTVIGIQNQSALGAAALKMRAKARVVR